MNSADTNINPKLHPVVSSALKTCPDLPKPRIRLNQDQMSPTLRPRSHVVKEPRPKPLLAPFIDILSAVLQSSQTLPPLEQVMDILGPFVNESDATSLQAHIQLLNDSRTTNPNLLSINRMVNALTQSLQPHDQTNPSEYLYIVYSHAILQTLAMAQEDIHADFDKRLGHLTDAAFLSSCQDKTAQPLGSSAAAKVTSLEDLYGEYYTISSDALSSLKTMLDLRLADHCIPVDLIPENVPIAESLESIQGYITTYKLAVLESSNNSSEGTPLKTLSPAQSLPSTPMETDVLPVPTATNTAPSFR